MTTTGSPRSRVLEWDGCFNVRDVGGLGTADGRVTRYGALVRSDMLCRLTSAGQQALLEHGVRTIVDVRTPDELARDGEAYGWRDTLAAGDDRLAYRHRSFTDGADEGSWDRMHAAYRAATSREELNRLDLDHHAPGIAGVVAEIADAPPGGVVVHCHAGKDRTGLVIALALAVAGVTDDEIADDYAMSALNLEPLIADWLLEMSDDPQEHVRLRALAEPRREAMLDTLGHLRQRYGSAADYLRAGGLSEEQLERLRTRLVEAG